MWQNDAACRNADPALFFAGADSGAGSYIEAKKLCADCDVRRECLVFVLGLEGPGNRYGLWAGLTPEQRAAIRPGGVDRALQPVVRLHTQPRRPGEGRTHGTVSCYQSGCRCRDCADTAAEYRQKWRARQRASDVTTVQCPDCEQWFSRLNQHRPYCKKIGVNA